MQDDNNKDFSQMWMAVSHDLRTPLNVIKGMTDISENEIYDVELMKDCLAKIKESTDNMQRVVNALIDYASIEQEAVEIQSVKMDFKTLITEIAMQSYLLAKQKKCHFNIHVQDVTEETLIGDEARISQILIAMLNAVVRYTISEGVIDFTVQQTGISNTKVFMRFCMRSTALEFPDELVHSLNDNSFYMHPSLSNTRGTFGITEMNALYFAYLMGGKIRAVNKPGDYSEFVFDMEFARTEQPYENAGINIFNKQRVLIVADTKNICDERGKMLMDMGVQYESATEIDEALDKIGYAEEQEKAFTICIVDWNMRNQKALKLLTNIREIFGKDIIILVTVHDPKKNQKEIQQYGANYVIDGTVFRSTLFDALISIEKGVQIQLLAAKQKEYDFTGSRILVAEDVALNMEVITKLLARVNVEVTCVDNGREAVLQFEKKPTGYFDVIFLDINMPEVDGYTAAKTIRESKKEYASLVPIYAMTANAFKEDIEKALEYGMDGHIAKPIDVNALYRILNHLLNKKEDKELEKLRDLAELDPLTGCLNRRGFESRMRSLSVNKSPIAYISIDADDFKNINDHFGHDIGDSVLKKIVVKLKKKFRSSDCFVRFGGDEFAVVLIDYKRSSSYIVRCMDEINEELLHPCDGLPPITISSGVVSSATGYSPEIYKQADNALYKSKRTGKGTCSVYEKSIIFEEEDFKEKSFTENIHYVDDQLKVIVENKQLFQSELMIKNKPVGFLTGFCEQGLPVYSFNGFFPELLGYSIAEFRKATVKGFEAFVHPEDVKQLFDVDNLNCISAEKIRLKNKVGDYIWFNMDYTITETKDNRSFWMASLKNIDEVLVGSLCIEDYRMIAIIELKRDTVVVEKGAYLLSEKDIQVRREYNYTSLITDAVIDNIKQDEQNSYMEAVSIDRIMEHLENSSIYEYIVHQKWGTSDYFKVRHKFRRMANKKNTLLWTWELLD